MALTVDLSDLTRGGEVRNLSGHERGVEARRKYGLAEADRKRDDVLVVVPSDLYTISTSFFQGMFAESVRNEGSRESFLKRYSFRAAPVVLRQIESGIAASLLKRQSIFA